jgi:glycosyltransferase involved in cell wall biosynthesis
MIVVNLVASPFVGGPERQMLGLARSLPAAYRTVFLAFANGGRSEALLDEARQLGCEGRMLAHDSPHYWEAAREVTGHLRRLEAAVLCCHGYKPDIIGWPAARRAGVPVISVAHGWTGATLKVRVNEAIDRLVFRWVDRVVCVSQRQACKMRQAGVPPQRLAVIRNAIDADALPPPDPVYRDLLRSLLPIDCRNIIGAAGRLSPEKGFDQMVEAAALVIRQRPNTGFVLFGDGPLRERLAAQIAAAGLQQRFVLAGFRSDLGRFLPHCDVAVLPSYTEGLPVVVLEAFAAGVPVVATAVGGTPEVVEDRVNGFLVPPGEPPRLAERILDILHDVKRRAAMGERGRQRVREHFTFAAQSLRYQNLFQELTMSPARGSARWEGNGRRERHAHLAHLP